ncbi:MAG: hypothetical protein F6K22_30965 [Okeania sp. SIO2F4]|uniref:hypothetical protein n=1 Tax=Okeania sp. SIO2F4 TaxID=2607790 RepID=UPI00142C24BE|nr:hypothetical protein [Okeania sp. SIO2F4]NES06850.1 hypothetical protein [Okeania sp. SIO2F4]
MRDFSLDSKAIASQTWLVLEKRCCIRTPTAAGISPSFPIIDVLFIYCPIVTAVSARYCCTYAQQVR